MTVSDPDQTTSDEIPTSLAELWPLITGLRDLARGYAEQRGIGPVRTGIGLTLTGLWMLSFAVGPTVAVQMLRRLLELWEKSDDVVKEFVGPCFSPQSELK
jgi:hypothetical protein